MTSVLIPVAGIVTGAVLMRWRCDRATTLVGFSVRLADPVGARRQPLHVGLRVAGGLRPERAVLPAFPFPLNAHCAQGQSEAPLEVAEEHAATLRPALRLAAGSEVELVAVDAPEAPPGGVVVRLIRAGLHRHEDLAFRETRTAGPVCRVPWSAAETVCVGSELPGDARCSPQNNSGVVADADGTLWQFTAFYSVDEQFGGGREGSFSRLFASRRDPDGTWRDAGLVADPVPAGLTYCGDPFAFRDLDGRPCLVYTACDGTHGFVDWTHVDAWCLRSASDSFSGPWEPPFPLWRGLPGRGHDDRCNCLRIFPRSAHRDYLVTWIHGEQDICLRGTLLRRLEDGLDHATVRGAQVLIRNQEEGGGGFVRDGVAYLSTWQIPSINDPTGIQRLYAIDLNDPCAPGAVRALPGSWGWTDPRDPRQDGGATADAWALSWLEGSDELWATAVTWSASEKRNRVLALRVPWAGRQGAAWRVGAPARTWDSFGTCAAITPELAHPLGECWRFAATVTVLAGSALRLGLRPQAGRFIRNQAERHAVLLEWTPAGARLAAYPGHAGTASATAITGPPLRPGTAHRVALAWRDGTLHATVDGVVLPALVVDDPGHRELLTGETRLAWVCRQGEALELADLELED